MQIDVGDCDGGGVFWSGDVALSLKIYKKRKTKNSLKGNFNCRLYAYLCSNHGMSFNSPGENQNADL